MFFALGLSATFIGRFFVAYRDEIRIVGGAIIVFLGLVLSGLVKPKWLMMEKKWEYELGHSGYLGSILVGVSFAAGWTPCVGPILGSVLVLSATQPVSGILLILAYILGFAVPFFGLSASLAALPDFSLFFCFSHRASGCRCC